MTGIFVASVEIELGWGIHDRSKYDHLSDGGQREREYIRKVLALADHYDIPLTFNVVGHLYHEECNGGHQTETYPSEWFTEDPETDVEDDGLFYASDVLDMIDTADIDHEVCTHTYSHILFDEHSQEAADIELERAQKVHTDRYGEPTRSLVPPRFREPPADILEKHSIETVRVARDQKSNSKFGLFWELLANQPEPHDPELVNGIVETYTAGSRSLTSITLDAEHLVFSAIPTAIRKRLHQWGVEKGLNAAARDESVLHLWCHAFDFANDTQLERVAHVFEAVADIDVEPMTMAELNDAVRDRDSTKCQPLQSR